MRIFRRDKLIVRGKLMVFVLMVALATVSLVGSGMTSAAKAAKDLKLAFIVKNLVNPFFVTMKEGALAAAKKYGVDLTVYAPKRPDDVEEQVRIMEDLIQRKVDAIIVVPSDSKGIVPGIEKANKAGIPIFVSNTRAFGGQFMTFAGIDHIQAATIIAEYAVKKLGEKGKVVILEGVPGAQTAIDRQTGFMNVLKKFPGIKILESQTAMYNRVKGMQVMEDYLTKYPEIDAVLAANDVMALGAIEAIAAAGRAGKIMVFGIDAIPDALQSIKEGKLTATLNSDPYNQAYVPTEAAIRYLLYGEVPPKELSIGLEANVVDRGNVDKFIK